MFVVDEVQESNNMAATASTSDGGSSDVTTDAVHSPPRLTRQLTYRPGGEHSLGYTETLMYGHYSSLRQYAHKEAAKYRMSRPISQDASGGKSTFHGVTYSIDQTAESTTSCAEEVKRRCYALPGALCGRMAQDWMFLTVLGVTVALFSFLIDIIIELCQAAHRWLYREAGNNSLLAQYFAWIVFPLTFICFAIGFTHLMSPAAAGSGIPEVKTILKGVVLKECLTLRTLIAKVIGLSAALGSGMPLGKVGPFVHLASVSGAVLSKLFISLRHELENESRKVDILTAAAAVGVACTFAAPIGGVLFSIEVTASYFAVRNYWRGFYSAICGAITFRLLAIWFKDEVTLTALFKTSLTHDVPYHPVELLTYCIVGVICGSLGALFVFSHKNIVMFVRRRKKLSAFLQRHRFVYPAAITLTVSSLLFPGGLGGFMAGDLSLREAVNQFFDNRTWWSAEPENFKEAAYLETWRGPWNNVFLTLLLFFVMRFWMCAIATTMAIPCGIFIPAFGLGASVGRLIGEILSFWFPGGFGGKSIILPGYYATVGAATFSGAVTHTVSTAVIVFELTGQMGHILPCVLAVMVANVTAIYLQPSVYDAMIIIKKLPFLPSRIDPEVCNAHEVYVENFMNRNVQYLSLDSTYADAYRLLKTFNFRSFPIVDTAESRTLLGAIQRKELRRVIEDQFTEQRRLTYFAERTACPVVAVVGPTNVLVRRPSGTVHRFSVSKAVDDASVPRGVDKQTGSRSRANSTLSPPTVNPPPSRPVVSFEPRSRSLAVREEEKDRELEWELHQLRQTIDFEECFVDPAPFQIPGKASLYKVHSLFSLLSLHHAFVTDSGRLAGIVSLAEVRKAIQGEINILPELKEQVKSQRRKDVCSDETAKKEDESIPILVTPAVTEK